MSTPVPTEFPPGLTFELPLWEERPEAWLRREYEKGAWSFERGYRQNAPREEDRRFGDLTKLLMFGVQVSDFFPEGSNPVAVGGFDPAGPARLGNALVVGAAHVNSGRRVVLGMDLWRGSGAVDAARIATAHIRYRLALLVVENNGTQEAFNDLIVQATNGRLPVQGFTTGRNKMNLDLGIPSLEVQVRHGMWALCMDDPYETGVPLSRHETGCTCPYHTFIEDLNNYPSVGRANDLLMAWWFADSVLRGMAGSPDGRTEDQILDDELRTEIPAEELSGSLFSRVWDRGVM